MLVDQQRRIQLLRGFMAESELRLALIHLRRLLTRVPRFNRPNHSKAPIDMAFLLFGRLESHRIASFKELSLRLFGKP